MLVVSSETVTTTVCVCVQGRASVSVDRIPLLWLRYFRFSGVYCYKTVALSCRLFCRLLFVGTVIHRGAVAELAGSFCLNGSLLVSGHRQIECASVSSRANIQYYSYECQRRTRFRVFHRFQHRNGGVRSTIAHKEHKGINVILYNSLRDRRDLQRSSDAVQIPT